MLNFKFKCTHILITSKRLKHYHVILFPKCQVFLSVMMKILWKEALVTSWLAPISLNAPYNTITILQYPSIYIHIRWNCHESSLFHTFLSCHKYYFLKLLGASLFYQDVMHMPYHICWNPKIKHIPQIPYILLVN
jgi:hypothetical protein